MKKNNNERNSFMWRGAGIKMHGVKCDNHMAKE